MNFWIVLAAFTLSFLLTIFISPSAVYANSKVDASCTYNGIESGKEQIVENFADITVKSVENFANLQVQHTLNSPDTCGK